MYLGFMYLQTLEFTHPGILRITKKLLTLDSMYAFSHLSLKILQHIGSTLDIF